MKKCEKCGKVINEDFAFCPNCGSTLVEMPRGPEICRNCGAVLKRGAVFCPNCGAKAENSSGQDAAASVKPAPDAKPEITAGRQPEFASSSQPAFASGAQQKFSSSARSEFATSGEIDLSGSAQQQFASSSHQQFTSGAQQQFASSSHQQFASGAQQQFASSSHQQFASGAQQASASVGAQTGGNASAPDSAGTQLNQTAAAAASKLMPGKFSADSLKNNKKLVIGGAIAAALILILGFIWYTTPRDLIINSGDPIEAYVGEPALLFVVPDGLASLNDEDIVWTFDDPDLISIEDGMLMASYDKDAFNGSQSDAASGGDDNTFTSTIHGTLKKGLRQWEGDAQVIVSLQEEFFFNGETFKDPDAGIDSYLEVKASDDYNTYFYLKSLNNPKNDLSFIVEKGHEAMVFVPIDTYEIYEAHGQTWYGPDILFGPDTYYTKSDKTMDFEKGSYWRLELDVGFGGNSSSSDINSKDFPDSEGSEGEDT